MRRKCKVEARGREWRERFGPPKNFGVAPLWPRAPQALIRPWAPGALESGPSTAAGALPCRHADHRYKLALCTPLFGKF